MKSLNSLNKEQKILFENMLNLLAEFAANGNVFNHFKRFISPFNFYPNIKQILSDKKLETAFRSYKNFYYSQMHIEFDIQVTDNWPYWTYDCVPQIANPNEKKLHRLIFKFDHPFWETFYPPNLPNGYGRVIKLSEKEFIEKGLILSDKIPIEHPYPLFAFNPLKEKWQPRFEQYLIEQF